MWNRGDRVLAWRRPGIYWYPGTVRHVEGERYYVIFDDGEDGFAAADDLTDLRFDVGDQVFLHNPETNGYDPARVLEVAGDRLRVRRGDGVEQAAPHGKVRVHPEAWKNPEFLEETGSLQWSLCDRVLACWYDLDWYPGIILAVQPEAIHVLFDTGTQALLPPERVRPFLLHNGDQVLCRARGGPEFFPGRVAELDGERVQIHYDNGEVETTSVRLVRLRRDEWFANNPSMKLAVGERVLARWYDLFWYPGVVVSVDGRRVHVAFQDGDQALVTPDQVKPLDVPVGARVLCRWQGGPLYYPGEVARRDGDRIHVHYEDGDKEWTNIGMVRLER